MGSIAGCDESRSLQPKKMDPSRIDVECWRAGSAVCIILCHIPSYLSADAQKTWIRTIGTSGVELDIS